MMLSGCETPEPRAPAQQPGAMLTLDEDDAGKKVVVDRGRRILVRLPSNLTTGYAWALIESAETPALKRLGTYASNAAGAPASGGMQNWSFEATGVGQQELRFEYRRPWERDRPPAKTLVYTVTVR
jgi:inhibitor of cysteine peptidase